MNIPKSYKLMLGAAAIAATTAFIPLTPASADTVASCDQYARDVARDSVPRRGPIVGLITLPFEVTGALLTGHTSSDFAWKKTYDRAYNDCARGRTAMYAPRVRGAMALNDYCAAKYRSYDPATGTYVTYSGEVRACR
ncbi:hypothetical protein BH10PSE7_BH10PSE7_07980 [soil metagenome]